MFLRLSPEEKVIGAGTLLVIAGLFMPWYSVATSFDEKNVTQGGFSGDMGVVGFIILIMTILAIIVLTAEYLHINLPRLSYTKEQILFFLMGQSAFLVLLSVAIYTKRSLEFTSAELRFGIYVALIGSIIAAFSAFSQMQKLNKKNVEEFFEHDEEAITEKRCRKGKHELSEEVIEAEENVEEPVEEQALFEDSREAEIVEEDIVQHEYEEPEQIEELDEEEVIEEIEEPEEEKKIAEEAFEPETEESAAEEVAEEEPEMDNEKEDEKNDKGKPSNLSMNFYED
jgi:hypothetical protein